MKRVPTIWLIILMLPVGCVDQIEIDVPKNKTLVIEGLVTNEPGIHKIKIAHSYAFDENPVFALTDPIVLGATVRIIENNQDTILLDEGQNGTYITQADFSGTPGYYYSLHVTLKNGQIYTSHPERLLPNAAPSFEVCFENTLKEISRGASIKREREVTFKVNFKDNQETDDYYRWGFKGVYEVIAPLADDPPLCDIKCGPCPVSTKTCWATSFDSEFLKIDSDINFNGKTVEEYIIYSTPADRQFNIGYVASIEQFSLTKSAFEYWEAIKNQLDNNGTIFETPNHQIRGNIVSQQNPEAFVLGYFGASAKTVARVFVNDSDVPGNLGPINCTPSPAGCIPAACVDCRKWPATDTKPDYWPN